MDALPKITTLEQTIQMIGTNTPDMRYQLYRRLKDSVGPLNSDNWWMYREATRFIRGDYQPILPFDHDWFGQVTLNRGFLAAFPHLAADSALVSWTPDAGYGRQDKRVVGKPGRLLQTHFGFDEPAVARYVNRFNAEQKPLELRFTESMDEINRVYASGPNSCMSKDFVPSSNPLLVYNCPHIKIAYAIDRGRIVSRTVCRTDREPWQFTRIYGNEFALLNLLEKRGMYRSRDGLNGIMLGEPTYAQANNRIFIAYLDSPSQQVVMNWEQHTLRVGGNVERDSEHLISCTSADGSLVLPNHIMYAWVNRVLPAAPVKRRPSPLDRFRDYRENEDGAIQCIECEDYYHVDECEPSIARVPVCCNCIDEYYRYAVTTLDGRRDWVHKEDDGLIYIECVNDFCYGVDPEQVFDVVEDTRGEWIESNEAVRSMTMEGYILRNDAVQIEVRDDDGEIVTDWVTTQWFDRRSDGILVVSDIRARRQFAHKYYYTEERTAHDIEEIGSQVAEAYGAARRSILVESPEEFSTRIAELAVSAESATQRAHVLADIPGFLAALVRNAIAEVEAAAGAAQPRSAAR